MKKTHVALKTYVSLGQRRKGTAQKTLATERAKVKLPYKPEHVTEKQIQEAVASLS